MEDNVEISTNVSLKKLKCSVQSYSWGRIGPESAVASLYAANSGIEVDPLKPYAEFWMGTHESGPSFVVKKNSSISLTRCESEPSHEDLASAIGDLNVDQRAKYSESTPAVDDCGLEAETLKSWIQKNPNVLGDRVLEKWGCDLPFLFKVLSVGKPLSIQAHPDKVSAEKLHKLYPDIYKDGNHKPEMALALTEFEALYGFLEIKEFKDALLKLPEIEYIVGDIDEFLTIDENDKESIQDEIKSLFKEIMSSSKDLVALVLFNLKNRLNLISKDKLTPKEQLVLRLEEEYPEDVGVLAAYFMNYVKLKPGQALYLGANELHAYLSGDCFECMATSDNVVRAGLTPKKRDVETLCSMLTYNMGVTTILEGSSVNEYTKRYCPPFEEFEVDQCNLPGGTSLKFDMMPGPSIYVIVEGNGRMKMKGGEKEMVGEGDVLFVPAMVEVRIKACCEMKIYRAGVNTKFFAEDEKIVSKTRSGQPLIKGLLWLQSRSMQTKCLIIIFVALAVEEMYTLVSPTPRAYVVYVILLTLTIFFIALICEEEDVDSVLEILAEGAIFDMRKLVIFFIKKIIIKSVRRWLSSRRR